MPNLNHVVLLGNCTRDPELRYAKSGTAVCQIGMAINHQYGSGDERKEEVCYIDVTCFGKTAEYAAERLGKGKPVMVAGRIQLQTWEGQDGQKRSKHAIIAETVQWFTDKGEPETSVDQESSRRSSQASVRPERPRPPVREPARTQKPPTEPDDDDIPF